MMLRRATWSVGSAYFIISWDTNELLLHEPRLGLETDLGELQNRNLGWSWLATI